MPWRRSKIKRRQRENKLTIPKDPMILLSFLNMKLRDEYPDLEELCKAEDINQKTIEEELAKYDFHYDAVQKQFK